MALKLYHDSNCPYSRKALIMASELQLGDIFDFVSPFSKSGQESIVQDNPLAKMPALVIAPGIAIFDSRVICRYVDSMRKGRPSFYPDEGMPLWRALRFESLGDGIVDAGNAARQELSRPNERQIPERFQKQIAKIHAGLSCFGRELNHLQGPLTVGVVAASNALSFLDFRWAHLGWRKKHPQLAQWQAEIESRSAFVAHPYAESALKLAADR